MKTDSENHDNRYIDQGVNGGTAQRSHYFLAGEEPDEVFQADKMGTVQLGDELDIHQPEEEVSSCQ